MKQLKFALLALSMGLGFGVATPTIAAPDPEFCFDLQESCMLGNIQACRDYNRICRGH